MQSLSRFMYAAGLVLYAMFGTLGNGAAQSLDFESYYKEDGLAANSVFSIAQDEIGYMWFGTNSGLQRFDGSTFSHYGPSSDSAGLPDGQIWALHNDGRYLWLGTQAGGLIRFDPRTETFIQYQYSDSLNLGKGPRWITQIHQDTSGVLWLASRRNGLNKFDPSTGQFEVYSADNGNAPSSAITSIHWDREGNFWVGSEKGLFLFDGNEGTFEPHKLTEGRQPNVLNIYRDDGGTLWCGTMGMGLFAYDPVGQTFDHFHPAGQGDARLDAETVFKIEPSSLGGLWIATWGKGVGYFDTKTHEVEFFNPDTPGEFAMSDPFVFALFEARDRVIWVATDNGLNKASLRQRSCLRVRYPTAPCHLSQDLDGTLYAVGSALFRYEDNFWTLVHNLNSASGEEVSEVGALHSEAGHWIPLRNGKVRFIDRKNGTSRTYPVATPGHLTRSSDEIYGGHVDAQGHVWLAAEHGLYRFDDAKKSFEPVLPAEHETQLRDKSTRALALAPNGTLWFATREGLFAWDQARDTLVGYFKGAGTGYLSDDNLRDIVFDAQGNLWIGTVGSGLEYMDLNTRTISRIAFDGFSLTDVNDLFLDRNGRLWISHDYGLLRYDPATGDYAVVDRKDGLLDSHTDRVFEVGPDDVAAGQESGFTLFNKYNLHRNPIPPKSTICGLSLFNEPVDFSSPDMPITIAMPYVGNIHLTHADKVVGFDFMPLHFEAPGENTVQYKLEGFDDRWIEARGKRSMTYTNLDPGTYTFKVRSANRDGVFQSDFASVGMVIAPPWWQTWWAVCSFLVVAIALALFIRNYELRRIRLANALKLEKLEAERLKEVDQMKSDFFANISHEFRTPLTVIMGQLGDALSQTTGVVHKGLESAQSSARRLLTLVNQILELSKIEANAIELNTSEEDIIPFLKNQLFAFESLAKQHGIHLSYASEVSWALVSYETDKLETVFSNLMSNAIKFTRTPGNVGMVVGSPRKDLISISVIDDGIGIPEGQLSKIFDRFHQVDGSSSRGYEGTGIGLALVNEFVRLHGGQVEVESREGEGSRFKVTLPAREIVLKETPDEIILEESQVKQIPGIPKAVDPDVPILLIVEDNHDVRAYIRQCMEDAFVIVEAEDGVDGLEKAAEQIPDLIISDIMMPRMDGFTFTGKIRNDQKTSHVPLIMLTAQASEETRLKGLKLGVDDFLTKPFQRQELIVRAANLIAMRKKLQAHYAGYASISPSEIKVDSVDDRFVKQVLTFMNDHIADPSVGVDQIASTLNMSASQLGRKMKALLNVTPGQLFRQLRLRRAADLLSKDAGNVSEVCFMCGFTDVTSFTRSFKREFGVAPSQYSTSS